MKKYKKLSAGGGRDCWKLAREVFRGWRERLSEVGIAVEIDETVLVRRKYNRGRLVKTIWLFGGIERESKKKFLIPLSSECGEGERRNAATLIPIIRRPIRQGSIIYSDCWGAYSSLQNLGYTHFKINHSENFVDPANPLIHTQTIERLWGDPQKSCSTAWN
uniref:ISXO2-like transposase domain-containing protein n=1 Tax=Octopus bimaculoides TaxID=37653 RepID=A0A0L8I7B7_OCTBM